MNDITLMHGDCLEFMKQIPSNSIDLVVTDPPYSMKHSKGGCTTPMRNSWTGKLKAGNKVVDFDADIKFSEWLPEVYRVLKNKSHCYIFCNDKNIQDHLNEATRCGFKESNILVWIKNNATPNRYYMKNLEFVLFLYKGNAKPINNMGSKCAVEVRNIIGKSKLHSTQKPVELLEMYIRNSSAENETVLDPFMGSGSIGVACINTGRKFIGMELDKGYFDIAVKRIAEAEME